MKYIEETLKIRPGSEPVKLCAYIPDNFLETNINRQRIDQATKFIYQY